MNIKKYYINYKIKKIASYEIKNFKAKLMIIKQNEIFYEKEVLQNKIEILKNKSY